MKYNLYFHCSENTAFYIFTAVKYSFFIICIIFNHYFSVFHYFVYNNNIFLYGTYIILSFYTVIVFEDVFVFCSICTVQVRAVRLF